jgi:hypothetical protein
LETLQHVREAGINVCSGDWISFSWYLLSS